MSRLFSMAVPIIQGKEAEFQKFMKELKDNRFEDFLASRKRLGVRERVFLQQTPQGQTVIVVLEGEDPEKAFKNFGQGTDAFTRWFVEKVKSVHNFDLTTAPPGPLPQMVIDSGPVTEKATTKDVA
ncbi:MAG: hypothetical protein ACXVMS_05120 [Flavisolibacter sp.]